MMAIIRVTTNEDGLPELFCTLDDGSEFDVKVGRTGLISYPRLLDATPAMARLVAEALLTAARMSEGMDVAIREHVRASINGTPTDPPDLRLTKKQREILTRVVSGERVVHFNAHTGVYIWRFEGNPDRLHKLTLDDLRSRRLIAPVPKAENPNSHKTGVLYQATDLGRAALGNDVAQVQEA